MKKALLLSLFSIFFAISSPVAANANHVFGKDKLKMYKAANLYAGGDYEGALKVYRDVYNSDKANEKDAELLFNGPLLFAVKPHSGGGRVFRECL